MTADSADHSVGHDQHDVLSTVGKGQFRGSMGVGELVMSVLAFSAPLTTVAGFIPVFHGGIHCHGAKCA